jgi:hypothetical protein
MNSNDYIDLQLVVLMFCGVLMLAVWVVQEGNTAVRYISFCAALVNAVAALVLIRRERKTMRKKLSETQKTHQAA